MLMTSGSTLHIRIKSRSNRLSLKTTGVITYIEGILIDGLALSKISAKVCPACLSENEYFRLFWHHVNVTACPFHLTLLIDRCQKCNEDITWRRARRCQIS
ncbi:TniQ family protein [Paenibacillus harenae]|uniref:TniQ family protein n=1 Tax=Paenibacillus harenae TaxID=306543 RepID=UPI0009FF119A